MHPFVVGELARSSLADRALILELLQQLPTAMVAEPDEALSYIERHTLYGRGIRIRRCSPSGLRGDRRDEPLDA
jgi:hypothetical protein